MDPRGRSQLFILAAIIVFLVLPAAADALTFTDITDIAGVGEKGHGEGVAFADVDNDGDLDFASCSGAYYRLAVYYNEGASFRHQDLGNVGGEPYWDQVGADRPSSDRVVSSSAANS